MAVGKNKRISKGKKGGKKKASDPFTKKDWYDIKAPSIFNNKQVGKTLVTGTQDTKIPSKGISSAPPGNTKMDLAPMKRDIDNLISQYAAANSTRFSSMKQLWLSKKFSYIYDARPTCATSLALFMQSLFSHSISHLISPSSLMRRLGSLYCLYCLHQTQPCIPPFKIYLSLEELKKVRSLVADAKAAGFGAVAAAVIVRRLLEQKAFLFGCVEMNEGLKGKVDELTELENRRIKAACEKLFGESKIEEVIHMDLGMEVDLGKVKGMCREYKELKRVAATEGGDEEMKERVEGDSELVEDVIEKIVKEWDEQRGVFYRQTGLMQKYNEEEQRQGDDDESFDKELEQMLSEA